MKNSSLSQLPAFTSSRAGRGRTLVLSTLMTIFLISLLVRAFYLSALITHDNTYAFSKGPDTWHYVHLAKNLIQNKAFTDGSPGSRYIALLRTPGYPFYYALFDAFGLAPKYILYSQVLFGALIPVIAAYIVYWITGCMIGTIISGILCGLSASGILMVGDIHVDLLLSFLFSLAFYLLFRFLDLGRTSLLFLSGILFGFCALVKPTLFLWPPCSVLVLILLAKSNNIKTLNLKQVVTFFLIQVIVIFAWCQRNYLNENTFTLSGIGIHTMRIYLSSEVELSSDSVSSKYQIKDIKNHQDNIRKKINSELQKGISPKEVNQRLLKESYSILRNNPYLTYKFFLLNIFEKLNGPMPWWVYQKDFSVDSSISFIIKFLIIANKILCRVFVIFIPISVIIFLTPIRSKLMMISHRHVYCFIALLFTFCYFSILSGFTFWTGPRIIFPAHFALIGIFAMCISILWKALILIGKKTQINFSS